MQTSDEVDYVSGRTRVFAIVGHPIAQVRSPEMFTAEFRRRGVDAILVPLHVLPEDFAVVLPQLQRLQNLGGLVFTIPYKVQAYSLAQTLGGQAQAVGAIMRWQRPRMAAGAGTSSTGWDASKRSGGDRYRSPANA